MPVKRRKVEIVALDQDVFFCELCGVPLSGKDHLARHRGSSDHRLKLQLAAVQAKSGPSKDSVVGTTDSKGASNGDSVLSNDAGAGELQKLGTQELNDVHLDAIPGLNPDLQEPEADDPLNEGPKLPPPVPLPKSLRDELDPDKPLSWEVEESEQDEPHTRTADESVDHAESYAVRLHLCSEL